MTSQLVDCKPIVVQNVTETTSAHTERIDVLCPAVKQRIFTYSYILYLMWNRCYFDLLCYLGN